VRPPGEENGQKSIKGSIATVEGANTSRDAKKGEEKKAQLSLSKGGKQRVYI